MYEFPNFLGVMVTLLANGSDPNDPPKEYRDLSEVGFDQKAKSEQQV